jgi:hypothetical protein
MKDPQFPTCAHPGCHYVATSRCNYCSKVYCVQHMASEYQCDNCQAEAERKAQAVLETRKTQGKQITVAAILVGLGMIFFGCLPFLGGGKGNLISYVLMMLGAGILIAGVIMGSEWSD